MFSYPKAWLSTYYLGSKGWKPFPSVVDWFQLVDPWKSCFLLTNSYLLLLPAAGKANPSQWPLWQSLTVSTKFSSWAYGADTASFPNPLSYSVHVTCSGQWDESWNNTCLSDRCIKSQCVILQVLFCHTPPPNPICFALATENDPDGSCSISLGSGGRMMRNRVLSKAWGWAEHTVCSACCFKPLRFWACYCIITSIYFHCYDFVVRLLWARYHAKLKGIQIFH